MNESIGWLIAKLKDLMLSKGKDRAIDWSLYTVS